MSSSEFVASSSQFDIDINSFLRTVFLPDDSIDFSDKTREEVQNEQVVFLAMKYLSPLVTSSSPEDAQESFATSIKFLCHLLCNYAALFEGFYKRIGRDPHEVLTDRDLFNIVVLADPSSVQIFDDNGTEA